MPRWRCQSYIKDTNSFYTHGISHIIIIMHVALINFAVCRKNPESQGNTQIRSPESRRVGNNRPRLLLKTIDAKLAFSAEPANY